MRIACQQLTIKVEYCLENLKMRQALKEIKQYAEDDRKLEAVEFMQDIINRKLQFESLIQWVKVVYAAELNKNSRLSHATPKHARLEERAELVLRSN